VINPAPRRLSRFLIELPAADYRLDEMERVTARSRAACSDLSRQNVAVRLLRSIFLPEDGSFLLLFEASSPLAVAEAQRRAQLPFAWISELPRA
jgi:hypothetical protein